MWEEDALGSRLSSAAIWLSVLKPTVHIKFFLYYRGLNLRHCMCQASTLPTELDPQPSSRFAFETEAY